MKPFRISLTTASPSFLCALSLAIACPAFSETATTQNARALLDEAKKSVYERKLEAKQVEVDRLGEDLKKGKERTNEMEKSVEKVGSAVSETTKQLDQLMSEKKRAAQELELIGLQIEAVRLKAEALKMIEGAHKKALEAFAKQNDETELRTSISTMEMRQVAAKAKPDTAAPSPEVSNSKGGLSLTEMRKKLEKAERTTGTASFNAREAMAAASARLQQAENAAAKAEKKQGEFGLERNPGFPGGNDPLKPAGSK